MAHPDEKEETSHYAQCSNGPYHPFRDHDTKYGWGVRHASSGATFALVGAKGCAFGLAAALNGHWEAARVFIENDVEGIAQSFRSLVLHKPLHVSIV